MMNYDEFKDHVVENIRDHLPENYADADISLADVIKNNDQVLTGLMIRSESNVTPNIYLEQFYEMYQNGEEMDAILDRISKVRVSHEISEVSDVDRIRDLEAVRDHIQCRLINEEYNQEYLVNKPYTKIEDLAVVYTIDLGESSNGRMSVTVTDDLMAQYGITKEELHEIAMENLANSELKFQSMQEVLMGMMGINMDDPDMSEMFDQGGPTMYVLTNESKLFGATAVLDTSTMDSIAEKLGGDLIVIPSSTHEVIILPTEAGIDKETLESMIQDVNATQVDAVDKLSDRLYMYDSQAHELVLADTMIERMAEREETLTAMDLATQVDQFAHDYDTYGYNDAVDDRLANVESLAADIESGNTGYITDMLKGVADDVDSDITDVHAAQDLLQKLDDYKPLAKIEEQVEENFNQIDNHLSNIPPDHEEKKDRGRVSVKEKLEEKKAVVDKMAKDKPEIDIGKKKDEITV